MVDVYDDFGETILGMNPDGQIASESAMSLPEVQPTPTPVLISGMTAGLSISNLKFVWTCISGKNDTVKISFTLKSTSGSYGNLSKDFYTSVNMYNSF